MSLNRFITRSGWILVGVLVVIVITHLIWPSGEGDSSTCMVCGATVRNEKRFIVFTEVAYDSKSIISQTPLSRFILDHQLGPEHEHQWVLGLGSRFGPFHSYPIDGIGGVLEATAIDPVVMDALADIHDHLGRDSAIVCIDLLLDPIVAWEAVERLRETWQGRSRISDSLFEAWLVEVRATREKYRQMNGW